MKHDYGKRAYEVKGYNAEAPYERMLKLLISPSLQEVKNISLGLTMLPPGSESSFHTHKEEETWFIISGRGEVRVDNETARVVPDTVIVITPEQKHQIINTGDETLNVLWIYTPPGPEKAVLNREHQ